MSLTEKRLSHLLLREKGDRGAVDEESAGAKLLFPFRYQISHPLFLLRERPVSRNHSVFREAKNCEAPWGNYFLPPASSATAGI